MSRRIEYRVDLDERGEFRATVYDGDTVLAEVDTEDMAFMMENMGVRYSRDYQGLRDYFRLAGVLDASDSFEICG
jgi:hypothetical protein